MRTTEIDIGKMTNNAEDKMKAGATAAANKIANTAKDLKAEYYKKKMEEHTKDAASDNLDGSERVPQTLELRQSRQL